MSYPRIIPCLLLGDDGLVKTEGFSKGRYIGDPMNTVRIFNEKKVDELVLLDINATRNGTEPNFKLIEKIATECRMPLSYGGGIKTYAAAERIISMGVEKVALSSAAIETPELVQEISSSLGRQSTVVVLDYKKNWQGRRVAYTHGGTRKVSGSVLDHVDNAVAHGAGEVVLYSIANDGAMKGYDLAFAEEISARVTTPLTFVGGAGSLDDVRALIDRCGNVGAGVGSMFVYKSALKGVLINYPNPDEKERVLAEYARKYLSGTRS